MKALLAVLAITTAAVANAQTTIDPNGNNLPSSNSIPAPSTNSPGLTPDNATGTNGQMNNPIAGTPTAPADATAQPANDNGEAAILKELHGINLAEMQEGEIARQRATSDKVKKYGETLVKDHTKADKLVRDEARRLNITLTDALPGSAQADIEQMRSVPAESFDKMFCDDEASGHAKAIADVETAQQTVTDKGVKRVLARILPVLKKHERDAQRLSAEMMKAS